MNTSSFKISCNLESKFSYVKLGWVIRICIISVLFHLQLRRVVIVVTELDALIDDVEEHSDEGDDGHD